MPSFTFTTSASAGTSAAAGAISGSVTPWYKLSDRTAASSYQLSGTFSATIQPEYSNNENFDKPDFTIDASTHTTPTLRELPLGISDYVRYRCTSYSSGSPKLTFAKALGTNGAPYSIPEDTKKTPAPSSAGA